MKILTKAEIESLTGFKKIKKIITWLELNADILANYNLVFAGGINGAGVPIVQELENRKDKQKAQWIPNIYMR